MVTYSARSANIVRGQRPSAVYDDHSARRALMGSVNNESCDSLPWVDQCVYDHRTTKATFSMDCLGFFSGKK